MNLFISALALYRLFLYSWLIIICCILFLGTCFDLLDDLLNEWNTTSWYRRAINLFTFIGFTIFVVGGIILFWRLIP